MSTEPIAPAIPSSPLKWLKWARILLLIAGSAAGYLAWEAITHGAIAGCGVEHGCNAVLESRWAYWMGLPVSVPALLTYVALFGSTIMLKRSRNPDDERGAWVAIIVLSVMIIGAAFWFISLQVFVIQSFCKYCLTAHTCGFIAALICLANIPYAKDPETPMWTPGSGKSGVPARGMIPLIIAGILGVGVLAAGQLLVQKERNVVKDLSARGGAQPGQLTLMTNYPADVLPPSPDAKLVGPHTLSLYNGQFKLKFDEVPMLGSPDAPHVVVCMLDYTCSHCRALHPILRRFNQMYSNQLAMICLPVTLSAKCNPFIPAASSIANSDSCEFARLGLAVWHARPDLYSQYDTWVFTGMEPPPIQDARDYAAQLIGADKLKAALADPWVSDQLLTDCKIHRANWLAADDSAMPQIVMGNAISSGPINSIDHLKILLNQYLGMDFGPIGF